MKKKSMRRSAKAASSHTVRRHHAEKKNFLLLLKSWMFVVMFALMLGVGAIVGSFINQEMNANTPTVAGASISR